MLFVYNAWFHEYSMSIVRNMTRSIHFNIGILEETARNHKNLAFSRKTMLTICGLCPITLTRINCFLRVNKFHIVSFWTDEYLDGSLSFFYFVWIRAAHRNGHRSSLTDFAQLRRTTCSVVADIYYDASCCRYF